MAQIDREVELCSQEALAASPCFDCLSHSEKIKAQVYLLAKILAALGGTDYSDINDLRELLKCYCVSEAQMDSYKLEVLAELADTVGATPAILHADQLREVVRCWNCGVSLKEMKIAEVVLLCKLFVAVPPVPN